MGLASAELETWASSGRDLQPLRAPERARKLNSIDVEIRIGNLHLKGFPNLAHIRLLFVG